MEDWRKRCEEEWGLQGVSLPLPPGLDWRAVHEAKPFSRNLLKNPSPYDLGEGEAAEADPSAVPRRRALCIPGFIEGDFSGWSTSTEDVPSDLSGIPKGAVVCAVAKYSWFTLEQVVDLTAEGLWEELLDDFQPEIVIQDRYEESHLHQNIYQLQVRLLGADGASVIAEHRVEPTEERGNYSSPHKWKEVSHVFSAYGPGVRRVHFRHRLKNQFLNGFYTTACTDSAVIVRPVKSS